MYPLVLSLLCIYINNVCVFRVYVQATYQRMYGKTLEAAIKGDTSGKEEQFFVGLINVSIGLKLVMFTCLVPSSTLRQ
jgi:uncharacterized membrane protein YobD (UPF0266 family)